MYISGLLRFLIFAAFCVPLPSQAQTHKQKHILSFPIENINVLGDAASSEDADSLAKLLIEFKNSSFNPENSRSMTMIACVKQALMSSPELYSALSRVRESGFSFVASRNSWYPVFSFNSSGIPRFNYNIQYDRLNSVNYPSSFSPVSQRSGSYSNSFTPTGSASINASLNWQFLDFSRQPSINSLASQYDAQKYVFTAALRQVVANIQKLYVDLQANRALVESYSEITASLQRNVDVVNDKYESGLVSVLAVEQANNQFFNSLTRLSGAINAYNDASNKLAAVVSLPDRSVIVPSDSFSVADDWHIPLDQSLDYALQNNDNILRTLLLASSSRWEGISLLNQALPKFSLNLGSGYTSTSSGVYSSNTQFNGQSLVSSNSFEDSLRESTDFSAYLGFSWDVFQGGVNTSRAAAKFSDSDAYLYDVEFQRNQLTAQVRSSFSSLSANRFAMSAAQNEVQSAKASYHAALARFEFGLDDMTTINQTVQAYQSAVQALVASVQAFNTALADLYKDTAIWPPLVEPYLVQYLSDAVY